MFKKKPMRIAAFIGTLGASATLIGMAATNTGAYFTDQEAGSLTGTSGHIKVDKVGSFDLNFDGLMPGEPAKDRTITYTTHSTGAEDIWVHFTQDTGYGAFTGQTGYPGVPDGGLGRFGHFAVNDSGSNPIFSSWNLKNKSSGVSGCADGNGHGFGPHAADSDYCGVPEYMLIDSNVPDGSTRTFTMSFGLTPKAHGQDAQWAGVHFDVVATQPGVRPNADESF